jgi:hypothetical protein
MAIGPGDETDGLKEQVRAIGRSLVLLILDSLVPLPKGPFLRPLCLHGIAEEQTENFALRIEGRKRIGESINT